MRRALITVVGTFLFLSGSANGHSCRSRRCYGVGGVRRALITTAVVTFLFSSDFVNGHEFDPGYLSLRESSIGVFQAQWKVSIDGGLYQVLVPQLPPDCLLAGPDLRHSRCANSEY